MSPSTDPRVPQEEIHKFGPVIRVNVGQGEHQQTFYIHETLLRARSPFFEKALSRDWKEAADREVNLPDDDADCFGVYANVLYTGKLAVNSTLRFSMDKKKLEECMLCRIYVLAEKLLHTNAKNRAMQALLFLNDHSPWPFFRHSVIATGVIYDGTLPASMARKLLLDLFTYRDSIVWTTDHEEWPVDFLHELTINP